MKLVIASDIHGAAGWCARLMDAIAAERPDRVVLLGDLLYHGPRNDIPTDYDPRSVIAQLGSIAERVIAVRGNCDSDVDQMVLPFACLSTYNVLFDPDTGRDLFCTHGHVYGPGIHGSVAKLPALAAGTAVVYGHTHVKVNGPIGTAGTGADATPARSVGAVASLTDGTREHEAIASTTLARQEPAASSALASRRGLQVTSVADKDSAEGGSGALWLFNPGSVGIPKDGTHSYGVYEGGRFAHRVLG